MQAHCTFLDGKRYEAIKLYNQVVDFFPSDTNYAAAAMYYIGHAYIASGDQRKGLVEFEKLVKKEEYKGHPLVAEALSDLADNYRKNEDWSKYFRYATQIHTDYWEKNRRLADSVRHDMTRYYIKGHRYGKVEELNAIHAYKDPKTDPNYYNYVWDRAYNDVLHNKAYYSQKEEPDRQEDIDAFLKYWTSGRSVILANSKWDWEWRTLNFYLRYRPKKTEEWNAILAGIIDDKSNDNQIQAVVSLLLNNGMQDRARELFPRIKNEQAFYGWYAQQLLGKNMLEEAEHVINKLEDAGLRSWLTYDLLRRKSSWQECITLLKEIAANDTGRAVQAQWQLGDIYLNRTRQYEEAVKVYEMIGQPPNSSFHAAIAFERWGKHTQASNTYREIENFFPDSGAEAAWRRGQMWQRFGDKTKAIEDYRRILKVYKGTPQASKAHEALEALGIATGGGELTHE